MPKQYNFTRAGAQAETICKRCFHCGETSFIQLNVSDLNSYQSGLYAQDAFPYLTAEQREIIISGTHPECWNELFGKDEEEDEEIGVS
jgi:hypothetical protein